jgi:hypothetical protein
MSYLSTSRLFFSGDFLSDVSTVNNDVTHYNNATFVSDFQQPQTDTDANGWWNPEGGAVFNFQNCKVQQITLSDGTTQSDSTADIVLGQIVAGSEGRPTGKMLDLDPDQQMVSALYCVQLRICTPQNELLLKGDISPTCFRDIQLRQSAGVQINGQPMGACWTSVLTNLVWGEKAALSPFLKNLKATTQGNKLSLQLNAFGYYYNHATDGRFSLGKILGSIGPWFQGEPETFAPARRLYGTFDTNSDNSKKPHRSSVYFGVSNFLFEAQKKRLTVDLGNSFPIADSLGRITITQTLIFGVANNALSNDVSNTNVYLNASDFISIGSVQYHTGLGWLDTTGGIVSYNNLPDNVVKALSNHQLVLLTPSTVNPSQYALIARESVDGQLVRADNFVQRLDYGDTHIVNFYTYQWGKALPNTTITVQMERATRNTPVGPNNPTCIIYGNNFPQTGVTYQQSVQTDKNGFGQMKITGNAIYSPRVYIDGQVYSLDYQTITPDPAMGVESVAIHLRDYFAVPAHPVWDDISEIMIQYANLYPIMSKYLVNLANPADLKMKKDILIFAFSRDINDAMHMPVTRDLSKTKRQTILKWLAQEEVTTAMVAMKSAKKINEVNPVDEGTELTDNQKKYKEAVKAKNGSMPAFAEIKNLFENL